VGPQTTFEKACAVFPWHAFACKCCGKVVVVRAIILLYYYLYQRLPQPPEVHSGFRCEEHNASTPNASKTSFHMFGMAIDCHAPGITVQEFYLVAEEALEELGLAGGIGIYWKWNNQGLHIDVRVIGRRWDDAD